MNAAFKSSSLWAGGTAALLFFFLASISWANHIHMQGGPFVGVVLSIAVDPLDPRNLYCAAYGGGVFRSRDRGASWTAINQGLPNRQVFSLLIDPKEPSQLYLGTDKGIFHSADHGASWRPLTPLLKDRNIRALVLDPEEPDLLYAGTDRGVFRGKGKKWLRFSKGLSSKDVRTMLRSPQGEMFAGTFGGVFKTDRTRTSWVPVSNGLGDRKVRALAIDPSLPPTLYAGTASGGVFKSTNRGKRWKAVNRGLLSTTVLSLVITPMPDRALYAGTVGGVFKSLDGGAEWFSAAGEELHFTVPSLAFDPVQPRFLYAASGGRLFKSATAGEKWEEVAHEVNYFGAGPLSAKQ